MPRGVLQSGICRAASACIKPEKLDEAAADFLRRNYPKALLEPMAIDVADLAHEMGLTIERHHITKDFSVFGQIFFADCDAELYDIETDTTVHQLIKAKTIVVDPKAFFLRNIGSVNNTIVHECVHWDRHRKVFELERLYNSEATQIKCMEENSITVESLLPTKNGFSAKDIQASTNDFDATSPLYEKVCVFTGTLERMSRKEAMQLVVDRGGLCGDGVNKKTNFLVLGNNDYCSTIKDGKSTKQKKAEQLKLAGFDIEIISENVFYDMIN